MMKLTDDRVESANHSRLLINGVRFSLFPCKAKDAVFLIHSVMSLEDARV